jgi:ketosteroid isomerase-like protein
MSNADVIRQLAERWNAGDFERVVELFAEDSVLLNGPEWPEQAPTRGRDEIRSGIDEWQSAWETSEIEVGRMEDCGETIVMEGSWITRGRSSGVSGKMPGSVVFTFRGGKIACLEWFASYDSALAAARGA